MKKILHVVNVYFVIPYFLGDQLLYFKNKGYEEHIICSPSDEIKRYAIDKEFYYLEMPVTRSVTILKDIKAIKKTIKYIKSNNIDIVVGHTPKGALIGMIAGYLAKVPQRIYFRHGLVYETSIGVKKNILMFLDKISAKLATKVVCVSPSVYKRSLEDNLNSKRKQLVLHKGTCNGINVNRFNRSNIDEDVINALKKRYNLSNEYIIGYVGRLVLDKGIVELVNAFLDFNKKHKDSKLLLVGMLEKRDALPKETVNIITSHPDIINTGYIDNSEIESYYALMNIFVLPSYREGFPTSVLEASSMGLPVITTKATGCIDSIVNGKTGLFMEFSSKSLYDLLVKLYENRTLGTQLGKRGRLFVVENFRQEIIWSEIEKLYKK